MRRRIAVLVASLLVVGFGLALAASAAPLEVTYYYLPT